MSFRDYQAELHDENGTVLYIWQIGPVADGDSIDLKLPPFNTQGLWVRVEPATEPLHAALARAKDSVRALP